jgi:outer membrane exchange protein TraA
MLTTRLASAIAVSALVSAAASVAHAADPVVIPAPVGDVLQGQGTGLCIAQAISPNPGMDFVLSKLGYNGGMNTFMEQHKADRVESVVRTLLDLSNNNSSGLQASFGDFTNAVETCKTGGCDFLVNDTTTGFGARARGYLNVPAEWVGRTIHFGLYTDDAASLTFFGPQGAIYEVITREPLLGTPTWRVTNSVTFEKPGVYPLEILFSEIVTHAALEMSWLIDDNFTDFERDANQAPVVKLKGAGFTLFAPEQFSQTLSGQQSFADINQCQQCERQFVNLPGNHGCPPGYYCNDAALCGPCDSAKVCGPSCSPCGGDTPFCTNLKGTFTCVECQEDVHCQPGFKCDKELNICNECEKDGDCAKGEACENNVCVPCVTQGECAGNSCNCCPTTAGGKQMTCGTLDGDATPVCVECTEDADCDGGRKCDPVVGRCLEALYPNESPTCCGDDCVECPDDAPYCLPTHIGTACAECRHDMDCGDGRYCRSGSCTLCVDDRRCGERCDSCGGDAPFCLTAQVAAGAECVRCITGADCGEGGECDIGTHTCSNPCLQSCALETPYCLGDRCVQCYADTQCPCGGTCNLETNTCTTSCKDNGDCQANEHCQWAESGQTRECNLGQMPDDVGCGSTLGTLCQKSSIGLPGEDPLPITGAAAVSALLLLSRRRRRPASGSSSARAASCSSAPRAGGAS